MPLIVFDPVPPPPEPPVLPPGGAVCDITAGWAGTVGLIDRFGKLWDLSDGGDNIWESPGRLGFDVAPRSHQARSSPAFDGAILQGIRVLPRELTYPFALVADSPEEHQAIRRILVAALTDRRQDLILIARASDGETRSIDVRYLDGLDTGRGEGWTGNRVKEYAVRFIAYDPSWYGPDETTSWAGAASSRPWFPIPGADTLWVVFGPAQIIGSTTVNNRGDTEAWPRWTIKAPYTGFTLTNNTSGKSLTVTDTGTGSDEIRIDTRPGVKTVLDEAGTNKYAALSINSSLWPLLPGLNDINITVTGSAAATLVTMVYRPQYEGV